MSQYSSVSKVRGYILDLQQRQGFSLFQHAGTVLGLILLSIHQVCGDLTLGVKLPEHEDVYSSTSRAKDKTALIESFTSVSSHIHDVTLRHVGNSALLTIHDQLPIMRNVGYTTYFDSECTKSAKFNIKTLHTLAGKSSHML